MNRYQREVAEMDRQRQVIVRALTFLGAAGVIVLALWSAGLPPTVWFEKLRGPQSIAGPAVSEQPIPLKAPAGFPAALPQEPAEGISVATTSSISAVPLPLYLVATNPGRNAGEGTAAIGVDPMFPQTYLAGAILENGARLLEIHRDHVVLAVSDRRLQLDLYDPLARTAKKQSSDPALTVGGSRPHGEKLTLDVDAVSKLVRVAPIYESDVMVGVRAYPGDEASIFHTWGLKPGDIIVDLNGAPLVDVQQTLQLLAQVAEGAALSARVKRGSEIVAVALDGTGLLKRPLEADQLPPSTARL